MYDLKIKNGGVALNNITEEKLYDIDSIFQRIEMCLSLNKGDFIYNNNLGSIIPKLDYSKEENLAQLEMYINQCTFSIVHTRVNLIWVDTENSKLKISLTLGGNEYTREVNMFGRI